MSQQRIEYPWFTDISLHDLASVVERAWGIPAEQIIWKDGKKETTYVSSSCLCVETKSHDFHPQHATTVGPEARPTSIICDTVDAIPASLLVTVLIGDTRIVCDAALLATTGGVMLEIIERDEFGK